MTFGSTRRQSRTIVAILYGALLTAAVLAFASHEWGATTHSLIAIVAIGVVAWHVYAQRRWLRGVIQRGRHHPQRGLVVCNALLLGCFVIVNVSGVPIWLWDVGGALIVVHNIAGIAFLPLWVTHLVLNRDTCSRPDRGCCLSINPGWRQGRPRLHVRN